MKEEELENAEGDVLTLMVEHGDICERCISGLTRGFGDYMSIDDCKEGAQSSEHFRAVCLACSHAVDDPGQIATGAARTQHVETNARAGFSLIANFDCHDEESWAKSQHRATTPAAMGIQSMKAQCPVTGQDLELFPVPSRLSGAPYSCQVVVSEGVLHSKDKLTSEVYSHQGVDTYNYLKTNVGNLGGNWRSVIAHNMGQGVQSRLSKPANPAVGPTQTQPLQWTAPQAPAIKNSGSPSSAVIGARTAASASIDPVAEPTAADIKRALFSPASFEEQWKPGRLQSESQSPAFQWFECRSVCSVTNHSQETFGSPWPGCTEGCSGHSGARAICKNEDGC